MVGYPVLAPHCEAAGSRVLITPSQVHVIENLEPGVFVVVYDCWCGAVKAVVCSGARNEGEKP